MDFLVSVVLDKVYKVLLVVLYLIIDLEKQSSSLVLKGWALMKTISDLIFLSSIELLILSLTGSHNHERSSVHSPHIHVKTG